MTDRPDAWLNEPAPTQTPVAVTPVRTRNRLRLGAVVGLITLALVATAVVAGGRLLQTTTTSTTGLAAWAPTDSLLYVETRFANLPAEQRANLQAFLGHFPIEGSSDAEGRIEDAFDRLIGGISDGSHDYSTEIKPWITGTVASAAVTLPTMHLDSLEAPEAILILGITDQAAATRWIDQVVADSGPTWERATYAGATLLTTASYSITALEDVLLLGETGLVKDAIDRGGAGGLASVDSFTAAAKTLAPDNLLAWYVDGKRYLEWALSVGDTPADLGTCAAALTSIPGWVAGSVTAEDDAMLAQGAWPHVEAIAPASKNSRSALLSRLPASTLVVADVHELGSAIRRGVDEVRDCDDAGTGFVFDQIDSAIGAVGGWDGLTGAIGETAFVLDRGKDGPVGGIAFIPTDPADAQRLVDQAEALIGLAGGEISLDEQSYAGETVTVATSTSPEAEGVNVAWVVTDDLVAIGLEPWVKAVLDTSSSESLASDPRFSEALGRVDSEHASLVYVNASGVYDLTEAEAGHAGVSSNGRQAREYLEAIGTIIATTTTSSGTDGFNAAITVE